MLFFVGAGEETSWGQQYLNIKTPEYFLDNNVQSELTIHNLEIFNPDESGGIHKIGIGSLLTFDFLYKIFWLMFGIVLPLAYVYLNPIKRIADKIKIPLAPVSIGIFFMISWGIYRLLHTLILPDGMSPQYYETATEIYEYNSSLLFLLISISFLKKS